MYIYGSVEKSYISLQANYAEVIDMYFTCIVIYSSILVRISFSDIISYWCINNQPMQKYSRAVASMQPVNTVVIIT